MRQRAQIFCWNEETASDALCKNTFVADLFGSQYFFEILQTSLTVKNSENVVKSVFFKERMQWRASIFFRNKGGT